MPNWKMIASLKGDKGATGAVRPVDLSLSSRFRASGVTGQNLLAGLLGDVTVMFSPPFPDANSVMRSSLYPLLSRKT